MMLSQDCTVYSKLSSPVVASTSKHSIGFRHEHHRSGERGEATEEEEGSLMGWMWVHSREGSSLNVQT